MNTHIRMLFRSIALTGLLLASFGALRFMHQARMTFHSDTRSKEELLYLPNGDALTFISFGYRNTLAHLLWFRTISYFGEHYASDRNYVWLDHMCGLVSSLIPKAIYPYQFCANMLSWEAKLPEKSAILLSKGIKSVPNDWHLYYLRGMTYSFFLKDQERARDDFIAASRLEGVPPLIKRLAAKTLAELNTPEAAIAFLNDLIATETDPSARQALLDRLHELQTPEEKK